jgi:hypothetical protein
VATVAGTIMSPEGGTVDRDVFSWGTINAGNMVELTVTLPSSSTLVPWVTLRDSAGIAVVDEDGDPLAGHFLGTIPADGAYYARLETFSAWSYGGHIYLLTDSNMTWAMAEAYAQGLGGHLVTINDSSEQAWLTSTFGAFGSLWIGLTDEAEEGTWLWSSGQAVSYTNWYSGEPNGGVNYNCAYLYHNGQWADYYASYQMQGVIELEVAAPSAVGGAGPFGQYLLDVDVLDAIPPTVVSVSGLPAAGATTDEVLNSFSVRFSEDLEASTVNPVNPFVWQHDGHYYVWILLHTTPPFMKTG